MTACNDKCHPKTRKNPHLERILVWCRGWGSHMYLLVKLLGKPIVRVVRAKRPSFKDSHALMLKKDII